MNSRKIGSVVASIVIVLVAGFLISVTRAEQGDKPAPRESNVVAAARETLAAVMQSYKSGRASTEDVYIWSRRVAEAARLESSKGPEVHEAASEHIARMKKLHLSVAQKYEVKMAGGELRELNATRYYQAAAERELELLKSGLL